MTDLEFVRDLVCRAGTLALAATRTMQRELKPDQSLVTNIDRAVEQMLRAELAERFPEDGFYGEESGGDPLACRRVWVADPVDGTTNMVFGLPCWGVSLGLIADGRPALGAFHVPRSSETWWFAADSGAFKNGEPLRITDSGPLAQEDPIGIGSEAILRLELGRFVCRQRNTGSLAAHWCYVAQGALRANVSVIEKLHDLAAAWGVLTEAGGAVEYLTGGAVEFAAFLRDTTNSRPLLAGPPETLARLREVLRVRE